MHVCNQKRIRAGQFRFSQSIATVDNVDSIHAWVEYPRRLRRDRLGLCELTLFWPAKLFKRPNALYDGSRVVIG